MGDELRRTLTHTIAFQRMAAIELRRIAEREPPLAAQLNEIAAKLEIDAAELAKRLPQSSPATET